MFALLHLIVECIRISILAMIYAYVLNALLFKNDKEPKEKDTRRAAFVGILFISLFLWRFSYWRDNGLGDFYRVPLSSNYEVTMVDSSTAKLINANGDVLLSGFDKLYVNNGILYASKNQTYCIVHLKTGSCDKNISEGTFISSLGEPNKLKYLDGFHNNYWNNYLLLFL